MTRETYQSYNEGDPWSESAIEANPYYRREIEIVLRHLPADAACALDLGAGYGRASRRLIGVATKVFAMDGSLLMLKKLSGGPYRVCAHIGDRWPFRDGAFDLIVGLQIANHTANLFQFMSELRRILRPRGAAFLSMGNRHSYIGWREGERTIEQDGFRRFDIREIQTEADRAGLTARLLGGSGLMSPHKRLSFLERWNRTPLTGRWSHLMVFKLTPLEGAS